MRQTDSPETDERIRTLTLDGIMTLNPADTASMWSLKFEFLVSKSVQGYIERIFKMAEGIDVRQQAQDAEAGELSDTNRATST